MATVNPTDVLGLLLKLLLLFLQLLLQLLDNRGVNAWSRQRNNVDLGNEGQVAGTTGHPVLACPGDGGSYDVTRDAGGGVPIAFALLTVAAVAATTAA